MSALRLTLALASALGAASCGARLPLATEELRSILAHHAPDAEPEFTRLRGRLTIDTPALSTTVQAVAVVARTGAPRRAVQLLPDVGPKVLDLVCDGREIAASMPQADRSFQTALDGPRRLGFEELLAISLIETTAGWGPDEIARGRVHDDGSLRFERPGRTPGVTVTTTLGPDGAVDRREFTFGAGGGVLGRQRWREVRGGAARRFEFADSVRLELVDERAEDLVDAPARLFDVERVRGRIDG